MKKTISFESKEPVIIIVFYVVFILVNSLYYENCEEKLNNQYKAKDYEITP